MTRWWSGPAETAIVPSSWSNALTTDPRPGEKEEPPGGLPERPPCPFCGGRDTSLRSEFGAHASVSTYWCRACHSPFEFIRWGHGPR